MNNLFVIPQKKESRIAIINNDHVLEIGSINIPFKSKSVISNNDLIIALYFKSKVLKIFDIRGELLWEKQNVPYNSIACKENVVYLGGNYNYGDEHNYGELFSVLDLGKDGFQLNNIDLPIDVKIGKSVDDILINDNNLILVDNIVYPKFLLEYDVSVPNNPIHLITKELPCNGTYEHIIKGDINNDWLVLFSSTVGQYFSCQHISVSGKTEGIISICDCLLINEKRKYDILDICLVANRLYVLRTDGLGYVDLDGEISECSFIKISTRIQDIKQIIKTPSNVLIAVSKNEYELIK